MSNHWNCPSGRNNIDGTENMAEAKHHGYVLKEKLNTMDEACNISSRLLCLQLYCRVSLHTWPTSNKNNKMQAEMLYITLLRDRGWAISGNNLRKASDECSRLGQKPDFKISCQTGFGMHPLDLRKPTLTS
jgi:hypothetical protein